MAVPDFQSLMLPTLVALSNGEAIHLKHVRALVAKAEGLAPEDLELRVPSGRQTLLANRVSWAMLYMARAGLVTKEGRGVYKVTEVGKRLLAKSPSRIDMKSLRQYAAYAKWEKQSRKPPAKPGGSDSSGGQGSSEGLNGKETPEEALDSAAMALRASVEAELLDKIRGAPPWFLEKVVVDLLIAMGYGGGDAERGHVTLKSGDGGIDGVIREDALGVDEIYVQAKRYASDNNVGRPALAEFVGALAPGGINKGVFVTTADFTKGARDYVKQVPHRIALIDGKELASLMVAHGIGVRIRTTYEIKRIDEDYFDSEDS